MPYCNRKDMVVAVKALRKYAIGDVDAVQTLSAGQLNLIVTSIVDDWVGTEVNYDRLAIAVATLECAKQEFYRRVAVPYEDKKREENGDVYWNRG